MTIDGQFKLEAILGGGSFGTVYRGTQIGLDRPVAVKVPSFEIAADPVMAKRFAREARAAARVHAPNVVSTFAVGELPDGRPYLAMQLVDGQPLDKALVDGPLPAARALKIARAIAAALSETHAADVVHRDLKPTNIMWRRDRNGDDRITLVDFGIAVCKPGNADATRLTANGLIGTPHYMSPEQAQGEVVDARADLYALGCLLFELVTGTTPFDGSGFEVLLAHLGRPAPLPSSKNASVPACVDRLCEALMQKKPDDRPHNADEVVARIDEALAELADKPRARRPTKPPAAESSTSLPRKSRLGRNLLAGFVAVAGLAGAGFAVVQMREHPSAADAEPLVADDSQTKKLFSDNGEMLVQATVAEHIIAGKETRLRLEIKNKLGQPVVADELVVTVADASGAAKGLAAKARSTKGRYGFRYTFPQAGHYTLRVFPPSVDSVFEIALDVE
jgi:serine/threonine-protein kinase